MKKRLLDILEIRRLKKQFPDANDFVSMSELFPNLLLDKQKVGKKLVPVKKVVEGQDYKKIYEEKRLNETLETDILPITYHSIYAKGVARGVLKRSLGNYPEFFEVFLDKYDKIILDDEAKDEKALVIDDYAKDLINGRYTLEMFVGDVLKDYDLSKDDIARIVTRIQYFDIGRRIGRRFNNDAFFKDIYFNRQVDSKSIGDYYIGNEKFKELKQLLECKNDKDAILYDFLNNESINFLNSILGKDYFPTLISDNPAVVRDAIKYVKDVTKNVEIPLYPFSSIEIDRIDSINTTRELLKDIDPTGNLSKHFESILKGGNLLTFCADDKTSLPFEFFKTNDEGEIETFDDRLLEDCDSFVSVDFSETIGDIFGLVNKITLSYIDTHKPLDEDINGFNNMYVSFYEAKAKDWLINTGKYDSEEIERFLNVRRAKSINEESLETIETIADAMARKISNNGELTLSNISDSNDVKDQKAKALTVFENLITSDFSISDIALAIGSYLGEQDTQDNFARSMMSAINNYDYEIYDEGTIVSNLMTYAEEYAEVSSLTDEDEYEIILNLLTKKHPDDERYKAVLERFKDYKAGHEEVSRSLLDDEESDLTDEDEYGIILNLLIKIHPYDKRYWNALESFRYYEAKRDEGRTDTSNIGETDGVFPTENIDKPKQYTKTNNNNNNQ